MTARTLTVARNSSPLSNFTQVTWDVAFPTDVTLTSFVCDIRTADTYTLKVDGVTVATVAATAGQTGVTFTPGSPMALTAGVHTFELKGTGSELFFFTSVSTTDPATGDPDFGVWGPCLETTTNLVPGAINFTETSGLLTSGMQRNASSGTTRAAQTWDVTFDAAVSFKRFVWLCRGSDTYKLQIDGADVATGVAGSPNRLANFEPTSPVALTAGTHTFKVTQTAGSTYFFHSGTTPVLGSAHVTGWATWTEAGGTARVAGLMSFALDSGTTGTLAVTLADATLAASGAETITGTAAATFGDTTLAAAAAETFAGPLATTLDGATLAAASVVANPVDGTLSSTLDDTSLAGSGVESMDGALAATLDDATLAATGSVANPVAGDLTVTLDDTTLDAVGTIGDDPTVSGILDATLDDAILDGAGTEVIAGTMVVTLDDAGMSATGAEAVVGTISITLADATITASGVETITGTAAVALDDATLEALAEETASGILAATLDDAQLDGLGDVDTSNLRDITVTADLNPARWTAGIGAGHATTLDQRWTTTLEET